MNFGKKTLGVAVLYAVGIVSVSSALAQPPELAAQEVEQALHLTPDPENGKRVFQTCAVCHTPEGWGVEHGAYPQIAGQLSDVIIKQLADIRARNRDNPMMYPFASPRLLGGPQEIADVAAYIASLPMNPRNGVGPGLELEYGERLYKENCVDCHGERGEGSERKLAPAIHGQHFNYLLRQFEWIRTGKRRNADDEMVQQIRRFSPRETMAVLDYVSRLSPPPEKVAEPGWQNPDFPNYARTGYPLRPMEQPAPRQPRTPFRNHPQPPQPPEHLRRSED